MARLPQHPNQTYEGKHNASRVETGHLQCSVPLHHAQLLLHDALALADAQHCRTQLCPPRPALVPQALHRQLQLPCPLAQSLQARADQPPFLLALAVAYLARALCLYRHSHVSDTRF